MVIVDPFFLAALVAVFSCSLFLDAILVALLCLDKFKWKCPCTLHVVFKGAAAVTLGSTLIGSPLPLTSLLRFFVESMMESFMTSSTRRLQWRGTMEAEDWLYLAGDGCHMRRLQMTSPSAAAKISTEKFMRRERRRLQARHIWMEVE